MKISLFGAVAVVVCCGLIPSGAWAQSAGDGARPAKSRSQLDFERASQLSDSEKLSLATTYLGEMKTVLGFALGLLREARAEKDVIKVNCVNEKVPPQVVFN